MGLTKYVTLGGLQVSGVNLHRYSAMLRDCAPRPDLDPLVTVHAPHGTAINVAAPYLDMSCFTPLARHSHTAGNKEVRAPPSHCFLTHTVRQTCLYIKQYALLFIVISPVKIALFILTL